MTSLDNTGATVRTVGLGYDAVGNPTRYTSGEGHVTRRSYDATNLLTELVEPISASKSITTSFGYDAVGARTRLADGRGNATWTSYNSLGLIETLTESATTAHPNLADRTWTRLYDAAGNETALGLALHGRWRWWCRRGESRIALNGSALWVSSPAGQGGQDCDDAHGEAPIGTHHRLVRRHRPGQGDRSSPRHGASLKLGQTLAGGAVSLQSHSAQAQFGPLGDGHDPVKLAAFIAAQRTEHGIPYAVSCRALGRSVASLYKWLGRAREGPSARERRRLRLVEAVISMFWRRKGADGSSRIAEHLRREGWRVLRQHGGEIMRVGGLAARPSCKRKSTTRRDGGRWHASDQLQRDFGVSAPDQRWVGDGTEIPTGEGKLQLAAVSDLVSRHCGLCRQ
ncbi:hypothetical protein [Nonomuraea turcica]|uniref:hypothetical protein n=1 Tax=Nonomuraea sp. G32 TaxID=3067274 RepID=UPI00273CBE4F|nr:hypothetical protein [Nonomuraea sp. G32]MDP4506813.1 hypothetical protein [Nonomuraea sp. G32]